MDLPNAAHRPWPLPQRPWVLAMQWHELLFMHWPVPPAAVRALIPLALALDIFDGAAWLGITPFYMAGVRPRLLPPLPWVSAFPELNVRTYVIAEGKPGVWFFSLDASNPLAVRGARTVFHLPYYDAAMTAESDGSVVRYTSRRTHRGAPSAAFTGRYRPSGLASQAAVGSLEYWLTERYCLYAADHRGWVWRGDIHHTRWPLQPAEADIACNTMAEQLQLRLPPHAPLLHVDEDRYYLARRVPLLAGCGRCGGELGAGCTLVPEMRHTRRRPWPPLKATCSPPKLAKTPSRRYRSERC